ncbi:MULTISPECIES: hypothetical protein [unclassified Mycobacterium]|uniref:hypothetical protein n=1 Tax=unclassified Mycobacterium TaxID=2642494 RepID=UPI0027405042|nr:MULTISPECIES: hypothetical protein [unclassified Mycobacterium]MDP7706272.1 hypothetical protein [Mycobacterium sp. TY815]MDP7725958.1 hypothetical protein [Mycobacterium sp. TY814]
MARTPQEVFAHHRKALVTGDLDEIVAEQRADDGVDTFVFRDGMIGAQTVRYTLRATA